MIACKDDKMHNSHHDFLKTFAVFMMSRTELNNYLSKNNDTESTIIIEKISKQHLPIFIPSFVFPNNIALFHLVALK